MEKKKMEKIDDIILQLPDDYWVTTTTMHYDFEYITNDDMDND